MGYYIAPLFLIVIIIRSLLLLVGVCVRARTHVGHNYVYNMGLHITCTHCTVYTDQCILHFI